MTIEIATPAQQLEITRRARIAADATQRFAQREDAITAAQAVSIDAALVALSAALQAAGISGLPATSAVVANGGTVNVENSAGALDSPATAVVASGVLTSVKLAATKSIVTSGVKIPATGTGSGNFATITVANGVITAIALSAS